MQKRIVEVEVQQSVDSCSGSGPLPHPTDVVLTQHHNRRTGRGSAFAPLRKGRGRGRLDTQLEHRFEVVAQQLEEERASRQEVAQQLQEERASRIELQSRLEQIEQMLRRNMQPQPQSQPQPEPEPETQTPPSRD